MSTKIYWTYKFSDSFNMDSYNKAIHFLHDMKVAYKDYLINNMLKELPLPGLEEQERPSLYLAQKMKEDMLSNEHSYFAVELSASVVCWNEKIVFIFFPNCSCSRKFLKEYLKDLTDWSYDNQVDDDFDQYAKDGRDKFWDDYLDEYIGRWCDITLEYCLFGIDDIYRVTYEITKTFNQTSKE